MAGTKFSGFTTGATTANTKIVGFDSTLSTNNQYTLAQLAAGIAPSLPATDTLYTADGNITTGNDRVVTIDAGATLKIAGATLEHDFNITGGHANACIGMHTDGSGNSYIDGYSLSLRGNYENNNASARHLGVHVLNTGYVGVRTAGITNTALTVKGAGTSTNNALNVTDSGSTSVFSVQDDGLVNVPNNLKVSGQAYSDGVVTLVDGATITPDWDDGNVQKVVLGAVGRTMANPSNIQIGATYILIVVQDGSGSRTITTWGTAYEFPGNTAPTLTTTADYADVITLVAYNADTLMCTSVLNFAIN